MKCTRIVFCLLMLQYTLLSAVSITKPPSYTGTWPPAWVGITKGADVAAQDPNPTLGDKSHDFDYGEDQWGYWANIEVVGTGAPVVVEMRYIEVKTVDYGNGDITGAFMMGAPMDEVGARANEKPQKEVGVDEINGTAAFMWVAADECSQELWKAVTSDAMSDVTQASFTAGEEGERGVDRKKLAEVNAFCITLGGLISKTVALPSEKEWEYVCRAGTATAFNTGRILDALTGYNAGSLSIQSSDTLFDYNIKDLKGVDILNGDAVTPAMRLTVTSINGDGLAQHLYTYPHLEIHGTITIQAGSALAANIGAQFDSRYQHRYVPDHYGSLTPILMLYKLESGKYLPRPYAYADPSASDLYYRYLDEPRDYIAVSVVEANAEQNHAYSNTQLNDDPFDYQDGMRKGDWYTKRQLEYREMVPIVTRFKAAVATPDTRNITVAANGTVTGWTEDFDGNYVLVSDAGLSDSASKARMYPIRSLYTRYRYYDLGEEVTGTLPYHAKKIKIEELARQIVPDNQKGKNDPSGAPPGDDMSTDDYVDAYLVELDTYFRATPVLPKDWWVAHTDLEKKNIDKANMTLGIKGFGSYNPNWQWVTDEITVVGASAVKMTTSADGRNAWGLLNTHGNLEEWTTTTWDGEQNHYGTPPSVEFNIAKGGSWKTGANRCRSAARTPRDPVIAYDDVGFRFIIKN